jgi:phage I-like protein
MADDLSYSLVDDSDTEEYLSVALTAQSGGFSKGTANVSPHDVTKLKGLLKFYAKKPHPFTACVKDNRKRFGAHTEQYCAVLKDLIVGNTKWRKGGSKSTKGTKLSQEALNEMFALDVPEGFFTWLSEAEFEEVSSVDFAAGEVAWNESNSWNSIRTKIESALNAEESAEGGMADSEYATPSYGVSYWVDDVSGNEALVCAGTDHYVVPFTVDKSGNVTLSDETDWKPVDRAWVEGSAKFSIPDQIGAEMFFADAVETEAPEVGDDGYIWKTILREGKWAMSPGRGQRPQAKPITVVPSGQSDPRNMIISMEELKANFEAGAVEHVTIPTSHEDRVHENTGFVKALRFDKDDQGRTVLKAAHHFTEPDIKEKALRGTIANTSAGILFDYVNKETGQKNSAVLGHVALTNHPWLNGMNPFGVLASENVNVLAFSEESEITESVGGDVMETEVTEVEATTPTFLDDLGLSEDEAKARLTRYEELEKRDRENTVNAKIQAWEGANKSPAVVSVAATLLSAAVNQGGTPVLNLSEDGASVQLSAEDIIDRLVAASPEVKLAQDVVTDKDVAGVKVEADAGNENVMANLSQDEKVLATDLFLSQGFSRDEAVAEAKKRLGNKSE